MSHGLAIWVAVGGVLPSFVWFALSAAAFHLSGHRKLAKTVGSLSALTFLAWAI